MAQSPKNHLDTRLMQLGLAPFDPDTQSAPVSVPAVRTSTVRFKNLEALSQAARRWRDGERAATYGRAGLETHAALEQVVTELESATHSFLLPSGLAGITLTLLALLKTGDHVVVTDSVYGPVRTLDQQLLAGLGITVSYCAGTVDAIRQAVRPETRLLYIESPGSLLFEMLDIPALASFARDHKLYLATDNTWGSGYLYQPLTLGVDVSIIAATKYIGGHSDLMLGTVATNNKDLALRLRATHYAMGYSVSADDAWLALRGVRSMPLRLREHARSALQVCEWLAEQTETKQIFHPAYPQDSGHTLWQRDCQGSNGMLAVALDITPEQARCLVDALALFGIGFSWGGFESLVQLVEPNALSSHSYWKAKPWQVLRFHVGLEHINDLLADLAQAFEKARTIS